MILNNFKRIGIFLINNKNPNLISKILFYLDYFFRNYKINIFKYYQQKMENNKCNKCLWKKTYLVMNGDFNIGNHID